MQKNLHLQIMTDRETQKIENMSPVISPRESDCLKIQSDQISIKIKDIDESPCHESKDSTQLPCTPEKCSNSSSQDQIDISNEIKASSERLNFIRKVLAMLSLQLLITVTAIVLTFIPHIGVRSFLARTWIAPVVMGVVCVICLILLFCIRNICRRTPYNYILVLVFTISLSYILGTVAALTKSSIVLYAGLSTIIIVAAIIIYACVAKINPSNHRMALTCVSTAIVLALILSLTLRNQVSNVLISVLVGCLFGLHLAYNIQKLAGKYQAKYSLNDYILASMEIYVDIVQIFMAILAVLRKGD